MTFYQTVIAAIEHSLGLPDNSAVTYDTAEGKFACSWEDGKYIIARLPTVLSDELVLFLINDGRINNFCIPAQDDYFITDGKLNCRKEVEGHTLINQGGDLVYTVQ